MSASFQTFLFVDLLDSLKQGTTGQLNIYDSCWLLQTVPGFADFAGFVEITRLKHKRVFIFIWMNRAVMNLYSHSVLSLQITLTWKLQSSLSYCTQGMFVIFLVQPTSPRNSETRRNPLYCTLFTSPVLFCPTMNSLMPLKERSFADCLLI